MDCVVIKLVFDVQLTCNVIIMIVVSLKQVSPHDMIGLTSVTFYIREHKC